jgi:hypothetical protein
MNRKEMGCAVVGAVLSATGCSPAVKSLAVPAANAEETASTVAPLAKNSPHLSEVIFSLISGTTKDISSAIFRLEPHTGWSISSNDPRLQVSLENGHVALLQAPEDQEVQFIGIASISHVDGMHIRVRCHVEAGCTAL